jgi:hypothetical protein
LDLTTSYLGFGFLVEFRASMQNYIPVKFLQASPFFAIFVDLSEIRASIDPRMLFGCGAGWRRKAVNKLLAA